MIKQTFLSLGLLGVASLSAQTTIVSSISDLSFTYTGGLSEASSGPGTLGIQTDPNDDAFASLPNAYSLDVGEYMAVTFTAQLSDDFGSASAGNTFNLSLDNGGEFYEARLSVAATGNGLTFGETENTNLGKNSLSVLFGDTAHTMTFQIARSALDEMTLSFSSPTLTGGTTFSRTSSATPIDTVFDTFTFGFNGSLWGTDFGGSTNVLNISDFSIETTGTAIPEPSTYAMIAGALALGLCVMRRRK